MVYIFNGLNLRNLSKIEMEEMNQDKENIDYREVQTVC